MGTDDQSIAVSMAPLVWENSYAGASVVDVPPFF
jgi:hypothetical protein